MVQQIPSYIGAFSHSFNPAGLPPWDGWAILLPGPELRYGFAKYWVVVLRYYPASVKKLGRVTLGAGCGWCWSSSLKSYDNFCFNFFSSSSLFVFFRINSITSCIIILKTWFNFPIQVDNVSRIVIKIYKTSKTTCGPPSNPSSPLLT